MSIATVDELPRVRAELNHLVGMRTDGPLTVQQQRQYEALLLREIELLTCGASRPSRSING